jgi:hypothetical protein
MINPDRWLQRGAEEQMDAEDEREKALDRQHAYILDCIKSGDPIAYNGRSLGIDNCDFHERIAVVQKQLMFAIASGCDQEVLKIVNQCFDDEVDSLVDLTL